MLKLNSLQQMMNKRHNKASINIDDIAPGLNLEAGELPPEFPAKNEIKKGVLYLVGTPIGNLSDLSPRGLRILKEVDFIAAEDTRVTLKLLTHFGFKKPLISCREHNIRQKSREISDRILSGETCATVTDAGMPCISDPGEELVRVCSNRGIEIIVIPGPTALISALTLSGLPTERFSFEGFLSVTKNQRKKRLEEIKKMPHTLIFYEAPHKLINTLTDLYDSLGERQIAICRELTKIHEEVIRGLLSEMISRYEHITPRGEFVLVVEGALPTKDSDATINEAIKIALSYQENGYKPTDACKKAAHLTGFKKSEIYKFLKTTEEL